jgi:hypothetical protein
MAAIGRGDRGMHIKPPDVERYEASVGFSDQ